MVTLIVGFLIGLWVALVVLKEELCSFCGGRLTKKAYSDFEELCEDCRIKFAR